MFSTNALSNNAVGPAMSTKTISIPAMPKTDPHAGREQHRKPARGAELGSGVVGAQTQLAVRAQDQPDRKAEEPRHRDDVESSKLLDDTFLNRREGFPNVLRRDGRRENHQPDDRVGPPKHPRVDVEFGFRFLRVCNREAAADAGTQLRVKSSMGRRRRSPISANRSAGPSVGPHSYDGAADSSMVCGPNHKKSHSRIGGCRRAPHNRRSGSGTESLRNSGRLGGLHRCEAAGDIHLAPQRGLLRSLSLGPTESRRRFGGPSLFLPPTALRPSPTYKQLPNSGPTSTAACEIV